MIFFLFLIIAFLQNSFSDSSFAEFYRIWLSENIASTILEAANEIEEISSRIV